MSLTDPIADMLTRIRNAIMTSYDTVDIPSSRLKVELAKTLKSEGYIRNYKNITHQGKRVIRVLLAYDEKGESIIGGLKRVSKPGCRIYTGSDNIPLVLNGYGVSILSTSKGIMTDREAKKLHIGGEILCSIW